MRISGSSRMGAALCVGDCVGRGSDDDDDVDGDDVVVVVAAAGEEEEADDTVVIVVMPLVGDEGVPIRIDSIDSLARCLLVSYNRVK
jgi:hypothetical protein